MIGDQKAKWIEYINGKCWWHVTPEAAPACYEERGRFYEATFRDSEFYGRPNDIPDRVTVSNPLIGDDDETHMILFGHGPAESRDYQDLCRREALRKQRAVAMGFDSIVVPYRASLRRFLETGRFPRKIELCLLDLSLSRKAHPRDFMVGWRRDLERVDSFYTAQGVALSQILAA